MYLFSYIHDIKLYTKAVCTWAYRLVQRVRFMPPRNDRSLVQPVCQNRWDAVAVQIVPHMDVFISVQAQPWSSESIFIILNIIVICIKLTNAGLMFCTSCVTFDSTFEKRDIVHITDYILYSTVQLSFLDKNWKQFNIILSRGSIIRFFFCQDYSQFLHWCNFLWRCDFRTLSLAWRQLLKCQHGVAS